MYEKLKIFSPAATSIFHGSLWTMVQYLIHFIDNVSYGCRWFIPSLVQVLVGCCVLTSCSVTLARAPVILLCCLVL